MTIFMPFCTASLPMMASAEDPEAGFQYSATDGPVRSVPGPAISAQPMTVLPPASAMPASLLTNDAYCGWLSSVDGTSSPPRSWYGLVDIASSWPMIALRMDHVL